MLDGQISNADEGTRAGRRRGGAAVRMVIFGAAGDLTKRLVVPALYNLVNAQRLSEEFRLVGVDLAR